MRYNFSLGTRLYTMPFDMHIHGRCYYCIPQYYNIQFNLRIFFWIYYRTTQGQLSLFFHNCQYQVHNSSSVSSDSLVAFQSFCLCFKYIAFFFNLLHFHTNQNKRMMQMLHSTMIVSLSTPFLYHFGFLPIYRIYMNTTTNHIYKVLNLQCYIIELASPNNKEYLTHTCIYIYIYETVCNHSSYLNGDQHKSTRQHDFFP